MGSPTSSTFPPFVLQPLRHDSWWQRLLGLRSPENARIEVENMLAAGKGGVGEISRVLRPYRLSGGAVREMLNEIYSKALIQCLVDEAISPKESAFLGELRRRLGLSDTEVSEAQATTIHPRFERALKDVLADAHISEEEREALRRLQVSLRLPDTVRNRIYSHVAGQVLQQTLDAALKDRRLSPEEEADFTALAENLGITPSMGDRTLAVMERFRLLWRIENGDIPALPVDFRLERDEACHFRAPAEWKEMRKKGRAPPQGVQIVKGVRFQMGGVLPKLGQQETLAHIDSGTLFITSKRLLFDGAANNRHIRLNRLRSFAVYSDGILVEKDSGRNPYLFLQGDLELAAVVLGALLERA